MSVTVRKVVASVALSVAFVAGPSVTVAEAKPKPSSVCETGSRGDKEYDRRCLRVGRPVDGFRLWRSLWVSLSPAERREVCTIPVREVLFDMAFDQYRNHNAVIRWAQPVAKAYCATVR